MSQQQGEAKGDNMGVMIVLGILMIIMVFMWVIYRPHVVKAIIIVAGAESAVLLPLAPLMPDKYVSALKDVRETGKALSRTRGIETVRHIPMRDALRVLGIPSKAVMPFFVLAMVLGAIRVWRTDVQSRYRQRYTLEQLIQAQATYYPHLRPLVGRKIDEMPLREGPWRIKYSQSEFAMEHRLILDGNKRPITDPEYPHKAAFYNRNRAEKVFIKQLGKVWEDDLDQLLPHERAMFGVLAAMAAIERKAAMAALAEMSSSWREIKRKGHPSTYTVVTTRAEKLAYEHWDHPKVKAVRAKHGYFLTVMSGLADLKQRSGELAISHFIWLRPTDPRLFYVLHQQGLPQPNYEAAAAFAHYQTEVRLGFPQKKPLISKAVEGLKEALVDEGWLTSYKPPEGALNTGASANKGGPEQRPMIIVEEAEPEEVST